jgi:predicted GNAT family acetyltransferase
MAVTVNEQDGSYQISVDGTIAGRIDFRRVGDVLTLVHTEVDDAYEGQGVAGDAVRTVLDRARAEHLRVVNECPYVRVWVRRHPEYADLVHQAA